MWPRQRWEAGRPLRFPGDQADLYRRFVVRDPRKVSADHVIKAGGRLWETPRGLGDSWVEVARHVLDDRLWVLPQVHSMERLVILWLIVQQTDRRDETGEEQS